MMRHLVITSLHAHATGSSVRRWNAFAWLTCVCLLGAGTCKSKSAVGSIKSATSASASKLSSTTVAPSSKRTTQDKNPVVTPGSSEKESTSGISTSRKANKATPSGGTAMGSKQMNASGSTSENPPIFSFAEQCIDIQTGEQKQLMLQASGHVDGYVIKSISIKREPSTTLYQNRFGLKHCIENNQPCFFPESGLSLNLHPASTLTAGRYTLTIRIGKRGVNSRPTNQLVTCEIVVGKNETGGEEASFVCKEAESNTANVFNQEEGEKEVGLVESKDNEATNVQGGLAQEQGEKTGSKVKVELVESNDTKSTNLKEVLAQEQSELFIAFSKIQQLKDNTLICKVGEKVTVDYEFENPEQYAILNVQMIKSGNTISSPKQRDFNIDTTKYKQGSCFENTITFCANQAGNYTLWLTLKNKGAKKKVEKFSCPISIIEVA